MAKKNIQDTDSLEVRTLKGTIASLKKKMRGLETNESLIVEAVMEAYEDGLPKLTLPKKPAKSRKVSEEVAVLHLADLHFGKITDTYDSSIAESRLQQLVEKVRNITNIRRNGAKIDEIRVYLGGDMIEGEQIFAHQAHLIDQSLFEQAVKTAPAALSRAILALMEEFPKVVVRTCPGNHGRNGPKKTSSHPKTNWDNVCYEITKLMLEGPDGDRAGMADRLDFDISETFYFVDHVWNWGNLCIHGDQIRGHSGLPWLGVQKKTFGWIDTIPEVFDNLYFGHFHTYASAVINHRTFYANGTLESDNEFAQELLASGGYPCQRLQFFNQEHGCISDNQVFISDEYSQRLPVGVQELKKYKNIGKS